MDYREFAGADEEQMNRRLKGGVKASLYTAVKNNGKERTGLLIEVSGDQYLSHNLHGRIFLRII